MTIEEFKALPDHEKDAWIAENVMLWQRIDDGWHKKDAERSFAQDTFDFAPSEYIADAFVMEDEIKRQGKESRYAEALWYAVSCDSEGENDFNFAHASPAQRVLAAFLTYSEDKKK